MKFEKSINRENHKPEVLYHASANRNIDVLKVRGERTRNIGEEPSIFATPSKAIASMFIVPTDDSWVSSGVMDNVPFIIISDKERFDTLDNGGSIYSMDSKTFDCDKEKGLRENEWTSTESVNINGKVDVDSALLTMLGLGVQVYFVDKKTFIDLNDAEDGGEVILKSLIPEKN